MFALKMKLQEIARRKEQDVVIQKNEDRLDNGIEILRETIRKQKAEREKDPEAAFFKKGLSSFVPEAELVV